MGLFSRNGMERSAHLFSSGLVIRFHGFANASDKISLILLCLDEHAMTFDPRKQEHTKSLDNMAMTYDHQSTSGSFKEAFTIVESATSQDM